MKKREEKLKMISQSLPYGETERVKDGWGALNLHRNKNSKQQQGGGGGGGAEEEKKRVLRSKRP